MYKGLAPNFIMIETSHRYMYMVGLLFSTTYVNALKCHFVYYNLVIIPQNFGCRNEYQSVISCKQTKKSENYGFTKLYWTIVYRL